MKGFTAALTAATLLAIPLSSQGAQPGGQGAIRALDAKWNRMLVARDASGIASLYAPDGALMFVNTANVAQGRAQLQKSWTGVVSAPGFSGTLSPAAIEISRGNDLAAVRGTYVVSRTGPSGPVPQRGTYLMVLKRVGSEWKIWNSVFFPDAQPQMIGR